MTELAETPPSQYCDQADQPLGPLFLAAVTLLFLGLAAKLGPLVFRGFSILDDEGYLLISLRQVAAGEPLYTKVWTQYGPVYYLLFGNLAGLLGLPITHDSMRIVTLVSWLLMLLLGTVAVFRFTGSRAATILALLFGAVFSRIVLVEPTHPQFLVQLMLSIALLIVAAGRQESAPRSPRPTPPWRTPLALGGLVALVTLTKVNVGLFLLISVFHAVTLDRTRRSLATAARYASGAAAILLPLLLTRSGWTRPGVAALAALVALSVLAVLLATRSREEADPGHPLHSAPNDALICVIAGGAAMTAVVLLFSLATGSAPSDILRFTFLKPLGFGQTISVPWPDPLGPATGLALAMTLIAAMARLAPARFREGPGRDGITLLKLVAPLAVMVFPINRGATALSGFAWLLLLHDDHESEASRRGRALLAMLAALSPLLTWPVAGAQRLLAQHIAMLAVAVVFGDGLAELHRRLPFRRAGARRWSLVDGSIAFLILLVFPQHYPLHEFIALDPSRVPLNLPGARLVRCPIAETQQLRHIAARLREGDSFLSVPGMNSFYLWAEQSPPTTLNATHWFTLFDDEEQAALLKALRSRPKMTVLRHPGLIRQWLRGVEPPSSSVLDELDRNYKVVDRIGGYEILRRRSAEGPR